jgi:hypothetical protein
MIQKKFFRVVFAILSTTTLYLPTFAHAVQPPVLVKNVTIDSLPGGAAMVADDLDADGRADIAVSGTMALYPLRWYYNDPVSGFSRYELPDLRTGPSYLPNTLALSVNGMISADLNGDGLKDLIVLSQLGIGTTGTEKSVWWYENSRVNMQNTAQVNFKFLPRQITQHKNESPSAIAVGDFNGDRKENEIVLAFSNSPSIYIFPNYIPFLVDFAQSMGLGNGPSLWKLAPGIQKLTPPLAHSKNGYSWIEVVDLDQDGDSDVVAATPWDSKNEEYYFWFENRGFDSFKYHPIAKGPKYQRASTGAVADMDGDGKLDLVMAMDQFPNSQGSAKNIYWLKQPQKIWGLWRDERIVASGFQTPAGAPKSLKAVNVSGNSLPDIIAGGWPDLKVGTQFSSTVGVWENDGQGGFGRPLFLEQNFPGVCVDTANLGGPFDEIVGVASGPIFGRVMTWGVR